MQLTARNGSIVASPNLFPNPKMKFPHTELAHWGRRIKKQSSRNGITQRAPNNVLVPMIADAFAASRGSRGKPQNRLHVSLWRSSLGRGYVLRSCKLSRAPATVIKIGEREGNCCHKPRTLSAVKCLVLESNKKKSQSSKIHYWW